MSHDFNQKDAVEMVHVEIPPPSPPVVVFENIEIPIVSQYWASSDSIIRQVPDDSFSTLDLPRIKMSGSFEASFKIHSTVAPVSVMVSFYNTIDSNGIPSDEGTRYQCRYGGTECSISPEDDLIIVRAPIPSDALVLTLLARYDFPKEYRDKNPHIDATFLDQASWSLLIER